MSDTEGRPQKLTDEAYKAVLRKRGRGVTDQDRLQFIAYYLRDFEADKMDADDAMGAITDLVVGWLPDYLHRLIAAAASAYPPPPPTPSPSP
jgi:hypothetical protein